MILQRFQIQLYLQRADVEKVRVESVPAAVMLDFQLQQLIIIGKHSTT